MLGGQETVKDLTYLNTENLGRSPADRKSFFDLHCENEMGEKFIIELQNGKQSFFKDRSIYYATFPIQNQAVKGKKWDYHLKAVYTIAILNFPLDKKDTDRYFREVQLVDKETNEIFYDKLKFVYLEVPNFKKKENELETPFDKWMYVLKNLQSLQERPVQLQEKVFERFFKEAEIAKLNPKEMTAYQESLKVHWDNYSVRKTAIEEGREEGLEERSILIAKKMKKDGLPLDFIIKYTGLTKEEVEKL